MGYNLSWIAMEGRSKASILDALGFEEDGDVSEPVNAPYALGELANGWCVLTATDRAFEFETALATASVAGFVVGCEMSETVMVSRACGYQGGRQIWSVTHDPDQDLYGVSVEGDAPAQLLEIRRRAEAAQAGEDTENVDYLFDVPIDLTVSTCGFRPDQPARADWRVLRLRRAQPGSGEPPAAPIRPALEAGLQPIFRSLGWSFTKDHPDRFPSGGLVDVFRDQGGLQQVVLIDYGVGGGSAPYFSLNFDVRDMNNVSSVAILVGSAEKPHVAVPLWQRIAGLFAKRPPPARRTNDDVVEEARQLFTAADVFLSGGDRHPHVTVRRGTAKDTWPALPTGASAP